MNPSYSPGGTNVHPFGPTSCLVNGITTDSVVFAKVTGVPNTQTNMNTDHRRCNTCSNSMHLSDVCTMQSCLILIIIISYDSYTSDGGLLIFLLCFVTPLQVAQLNIYNAAVQCLHLWLGRRLWNVFHKQQSPIQRIWNKITTGSRCLFNQMSLNNHLPGEPGPAHLASFTCSKTEPLEDYRNEFLSHKLDVLLTNCSITFHQCQSTKETKSINPISCLASYFLYTLRVLKSNKDIWLWQTSTYTCAA